MINRPVLAVVLGLAVNLCVATLGLAVPAENGRGQAIESFARQMAEAHNFDAAQIIAQLNELKPRQDIIRKISRPAESMPWYRYRKIWMQPERISAGVAFWQANAKTLARAEQEFGVEAEMIVAIIGIETYYGRHLGSYPVLEALYTLGFHYPKRAKFFRGELAEYYLLARAEQWPLAEIKGSYAGAMGMGQFISSSYRQYGVDFDSDGNIDLFASPIDMIGSVANYFARHGWHKGSFVAAPLTQAILKVRAKVQRDLKLKTPFADLTPLLQGDASTALEKGSEKAGVFAFAQQKGEDYWLVGDNFYAITRYNHNAMYALAAFQLGEAIRAEMSSKKLAQRAPE